MWKPKARIAREKSLLARTADHRADKREGDRSQGERRLQAAAARSMIFATSLEDSNFCLLMVYCAVARYAAIRKAVTAFDTSARVRTLARLRP